MRTFLIIATAISLSGCNPVKPDVSEKDTTLEITGHEFRKTGAINTNILYAGVKRVNGVNVFNPKFDPKFYPVIENEITAKLVTGAFNEQTGAAAIQATSQKGIDGELSSDSSTKGNYFVSILYDVNDFVKALNSPKNRANIESLMRYDHPRIITSIATVFNRESTQKIRASSDLSLTIKNLGLPELAIKSQGSAESVGKLADGTIFAYEYSTICWEKKDDKVQVASIEVDRPGFEGVNSCPSGTSENANSLNK